MSIAPPPGPKPNAPPQCEACGVVVLVVAVITGCYAAGFGAPGWLALGLALNVWLLGTLAIRVLGAASTGPDTTPRDDHTRGGVG